GYYIYLLPGLNGLAIPVFFYFLVITVMCWQGISLYLWKNSRALQYIAMGSVFFLISDSILAFNKFATPFELARILTLSTYWLSVGLIAIGLSRVELKPANTET
ncbi:MAG: lysoplasmalogenase, partial [Bacteroidia bacterium]|nr:lysoplasmalogenase [Bacteroidia bacterium]